MNPGRRVASPRSTTVAPAGTGRPEPTSLIFVPSITTTALARVRSERPSNIRAALTTVVAAGVGTGAAGWAAAVTAVQRAMAIARTDRLMFLPVFRERI